MEDKEYSRVAEEQEIQEGVGPEEVDEGAAQAPACGCEYGETSEEQQDGVEEGDLLPLGSLGQGETGWAGVWDGHLRDWAQMPPGIAWDPTQEGGKSKPGRI